jgi:hypothetical protein
LRVSSWLPPASSAAGPVQGCIGESGVRVFPGPWVGGRRRDVQMARGLS